MRTVSATFNGSATTANDRLPVAVRGMLDRALQMLDRFALPRPPADRAELPPEFFKYPPV